MNIADLRQEFMRAGLSEARADPDPIRQFEHWFEDALRARLPLPNAMTLATARRGRRMGAAPGVCRSRSSSGRDAPTGCTTGCCTAAGEAPGPLSASLPEAILGLLRGAGLAAADEVPAATALAGGVSSEIWRVDLARGPVCVKRALPRLKVAQLWEAPVERNRYEQEWIRQT